MKLKKKTPISLRLKTRVQIGFNTGTRVMISKKDKACSRQVLKKQLISEIS